MPPKITQRIKDVAFDLLKQHPEGVRYSELVSKILERDPSFNPNTIQGTIWDLDTKYSSRVYKPSRGVFRLLEYKTTEVEELRETQTPPIQTEVAEADFYRPFADYLIHELEEVRRPLTTRAARAVV
jgi:hypothetical protein